MKRAIFSLEKIPTKRVYSTKTIAPVYIPFKCPVCNGYGTLGRETVKECHGCGGLGWVVVDQKESL